MKNSEFVASIISRQIIELNNFNKKNKQGYFESDEVDQQKRNCSEIKTEFKEEKWSSQSYSENMIKDYISTDTLIYLKYNELA